MKKQLINSALPKKLTIKITIFTIVFYTPKIKFTMDIENSADFGFFLSEKNDLKMLKSGENG